MVILRHVEQYRFLEYLINFSLKLIVACNAVLNIVFSVF